MRILSVRLRNLNSLAGSWTIDLSTPEFAASGIFAITGPTGAGKSTILDAICLALFARTPRLGHISKSSNEIMSRRAGDCYAEVEFETQQGRYRCHWGQHRARRGADGELQAPRHEIVDALSEKVLESRGKEVIRLVERVTGMDYDRFTRSMLLAQGDFAAFLQAEADQRAPILEQITGTSIYSRISMAVHERTSEERRTTTLLEEAMAGVHLLSDEEQHALTTLISEDMAAAKPIEQRLVLLGQALNRLDRIEELHRLVAMTDQLLDDLARRRQAASAELLRLERGQRAHGLAAEHALFCQVQEQIAAQRTQTAALRATLEQMDKEQQEMTRNHGQAAQALQETMAHRQRENEVLQVVRGIDLRLHEKKQVITRHAALCRQVEQERAQATERRQNLVGQLAEVQTQEDRLDAFFRDHSGDGMLIEHLAGFRQQLQHLASWEQALSRLEEERSGKQAAHAEAERHGHALTAEETRMAEAVAGLRLRQQNLEDERIARLAGQDPAFWRHQVEVAHQQLQRLEQAGQLHSQRLAVDRELATCQQGMQEARERQRHQSEVLQELEANQALRLQVLDQMEHNQELQRLVRSYEEERHRLQPGTACPLCGSTQHPWAEDHPPAFQDEPVAEARAALVQTQSAIARAREGLAALARDIDHGEQALARGRQQQAALSAQWASLDLQGVETVGEQQLATAQAQLDDIRRCVQHLDRLEGELRQARTQIEQAVNQHTNLRQQVHTARHDLATLAGEVDRLTRQQLAEQARIEAGRADLLTQLHPLGIEQCPPGQSAPLLAELELRLQVWKERQERKEHLLQARGQLQTEVDKLDLLLVALGRTLAQQEAESAHVRQDEAALLAQRHDLFGDRDPHVEEQRLHAAVQQAEARELQLRERLAGIDREMHALAERLRLGEEALAYLLPHHQEQQALLLARAAAAGFADLEDFREALLPPEALTTLAERRRALEEEQTTLAARRAEQAMALERAREEAAEQGGREELLDDRARCTQEFTTLQQRIGAARERLAVNERNQRQVEVQRGALTSQRAELERWELLHQLIGSADGKKFRVFAQGLTFEVMISHANRQLRKMSDRYILLRDVREPLALQVLDNYQAGEIRSTRNLSGGESFLVSLALALGLSAMASHNVRVDSLFLDEGFGTLDEEALDTALQTLAELRQDGKLIGVISHVPVLRDRIDLRIQVLPGPDGCSRLLGPGCSRVG